MPETKGMMHEDLAAADRLLKAEFTEEARYPESISVGIGPYLATADLPEGFGSPLKQRYEGFVRNGEPDLQLKVQRSETFELKQYPDTHVESLPGGEVHYVFRWEFLAQIDLKERQVLVLVTPLGSHTSVDSAIRISMSFLLVAGGGFLLHCAGADISGSGYVFAGPSGSGKSTIVDLLGDQAQKILTDEIALVDRAESGYTVWGTPFWGEKPNAENLGVPLKAVFLLSKAKETQEAYIERAGIMEALPELMRTVLYFGQDVENTNKLLQVMMEFMDNIQIKRLHFKLSSNIREVIEE